MQTLIGRLTADAKINQTKDGRKVVNFSLALNRKYKAKGSDEVKESTTYVNCSYWLSTGIAAYLKKGNLVATTGHIGLDTWTSPDGEARASIIQQVQNIDLYSPKPKDTPPPPKQTNKRNGKKKTKAATGATPAETTDDLSF